MKLKRLTLANFRIFDQAAFDFQPDMNLLVGINGVGKSSVLDALRVLLSQALPKFTASRRGNTDPFDLNDITVGKAALTADLQFEAANISFTQLIHKPRERYVAEKGKEGAVRGQTHDLIERNELTPSLKDIPKPLKTSAEQPLAVYFSTRRSLPSDATPSKQASAGGPAAAFVQALSPRELRIQEFSEWLLVQEAIVQENKDLLSTRHLGILNAAAMRFLDQYSSLRAIRISKDKSTLILKKGDVSLDVRQLSDGERGILSLVLDLAQRLSQANPKLEDPLQDGKAVVLIDELDLHLHPRWQRTVIEKLTTTFPNCQFIMTTHSPQIIGEVSPDNIILLESGQPPYRPNQSRGMDSNWILRYLMDAAERDLDTKQKLSRIEDLIDEEQYDEATVEIDRLRSTLGEFPELIRLQTRIDRIRLLEE